MWSAAHIQDFKRKGKLFARGIIVGNLGQAAETPVSSLFSVDADENLPTHMAQLLSGGWYQRHYVDGFTFMGSDRFPKDGETRLLSPYGAYVPKEAMAGDLLVQMAGANMAYVIRSLVDTNIPDMQTSKQGSSRSKSRIVVKAKFLGIAAFWRLSLSSWSSTHHLNNLGLDFTIYSHNVIQSRKPVNESITLTVKAWKRSLADSQSGHAVVPVGKPSTGGHQNYCEVHPTLESSLQLERVIQAFGDWRPDKHDALQNFMLL